MEYSWQQITTIQTQNNMGRWTLKQNRNVKKHQRIKSRSSFLSSNHARPRKSVGVYWQANDTRLTVKTSRWLAHAVCRTRQTVSTTLCDCCGDPERRSGEVTHIYKYSLLCWQFARRIMTDQEKKMTQGSTKVIQNEYAITFAYGLGVFATLYKMSSNHRIESFLCIKPKIWNVDSWLCNFSSKRKQVKKQIS